MTEVTRTVVIGPQSEALRMQSFELSWERHSQRFRSRSVRIGSDPRSDFVVDAPSVSRTHCTIQVDEQGYRIEDQQSKNGTRVDGVRVEAAYLDPDCEISLGGERLRFRLAGDEVEIPISRRTRFGELRGRSDAMREVFGLLERVAPTDATVLIEGESGTGKELAARAVHDASERRDGPFMVFDCSAISADIIESELFGHVKGAFTGATADREGAFESAAGGTLFIDEIGELSASLQPKLLRVLEGRTIRRVGTNEQRPIDVRVIAATNRKLSEAVSMGDFREDLYYRLAVLKVSMPPLRERVEDIPFLVSHFLDEFATNGRKLNVGFETMEKLKEFPWPGNIRELRNYVERAAILAQGSTLDAEYLDLNPRARKQADTDEVVDLLARLGFEPDEPFKEAKERLINEFELRYWQRALERHDGNLSAAAREADVHRKSAEYIVKKLGLRS